MLQIVQTIELYSKAIFVNKSYPWLKPQKGILPGDPVSNFIHPFLKKRQTIPQQTELPTDNWPLFVNKIKPIVAGNRRHQQNIQYSKTLHLGTEQDFQDGNIKLGLRISQGLTEHIWI